jgi:orotate phosphoribosyltransferase
MLAEEKIEAYTLTDIEALTKVAIEKGYIQEEDMKKLIEWRKDPSEWGKVTQY